MLVTHSIHPVLPDVINESKSIKCEAAHYALVFSPFLLHLSEFQISFSVVYKTFPWMFYVNPSSVWRFLSNTPPFKLPINVTRGKISRRAVLFWLLLPLFLFSNHTIYFNGFSVQKWFRFRSPDGAVGPKPCSSRWWAPRIILILMEIKSR